MSNKYNENTMYKHVLRCTKGRMDTKRINSEEIDDNFIIETLISEFENFKKENPDDEIAQKVIYNWDDAKVWYKADNPKRANDYYIIIPSSIQNSVDNLVAWRQAQGYDVNVITVEYIESNINGDDLQQKIRNYLRGNLVDIEYVLLVGLSTDLPWRNMVPFNNDPDSPYNNPDYSPIPSDLYYAELTDHDTLSWNSDRDILYGEVYTQDFQPIGDDDPDYHADVHLGRIPLSNQDSIEAICDKEIDFDGNSDLSYKAASLLAGALYYYENENNGGGSRNDGADYMEELMNDHNLSYEAQLRELYTMGNYLEQKKYRFVRLAYISFISGAVISSTAYIVGSFT